jgi:chromate transporter
MAALQREFVEREKWLEPEDYALAFSLARVTPGTNIVAFCAATGAQILGIRGALAGVFSETLPSAALAVLMTQGYESWRSNPVVMAGVAATIAAVVGMMWSAVWGLVAPHWGGVQRSIRTVAITGGAFLAFWKLGMSPLPIIGIAALVGVLWREPAKQ